MIDDTLERQSMDLLHSQYQALLEISEAIASHQELDQLFTDLTPRLHRVVQFDFANLILYEPSSASRSGSG
jgi:transcriptional regulator with GAF, ATPase, and Fis domain